MLVLLHRIIFLVQPKSIPPDYFLSATKISLLIVLCAFDGMEITYTLAIVDY